MAPEESKRCCSVQLAVPNEELALAEAEASESFPATYFERNTFIDFPVLPMARPSTPSSSLPAGFLQRFLLLPQKSATEALPLGAPCSTECSETDAMEILSTLEELPEKHTFVDFPPCPMARPPTSTSSAPPGNQVVEASEISSTCGDCGNILLPDGNFCRKCGKRRPDASIDADCGRSALSSADLPVTEQPVSEQLAGVGLPCIGSASHQDGKCSPCAWFWKSGGCRSGVTCTYCHSCPEGTRKAMKKAKVAMFRQQAEPSQQQLEPAYVSCVFPVCESAPPSPLSLSLASVKEVEEVTVRFAENEQGEAVARAPVKVSVKNTFIQFEVPSSPKNTSEPPSRTAPGDFFRRFFKTMEPETLLSATPETPTSFHDCGFNSRPAADASMIALMPSHGEPEHNINGPQAHALGQCTPCAYFWYKGDGCRKGEECEMCHLCPKGEIKRRKKERVQQLKAVGAYMPGFSKVRMHSGH